MCTERRGSLAKCVSKRFSGEDITLRCACHDEINRHLIAWSNTDRILNLNPGVHYYRKSARIEYIIPPNFPGSLDPERYDKHHPIRIITTKKTWPNPGNNPSPDSFGAKCCFEEELVLIPTSIIVTLARLQYFAWFVKATFRPVLCILARI